MEFVEVESESKKLLKKKPFRRLYKNLPKDNLTPIYAFENFESLTNNTPEVNSF